MYISTVLSLDAASDNAILMSIAYGNEGEDYEIVTNDDGTKEIVMKEGKSPRTVKDLKDKSTIDSVRLSAIITPDPEDKITMYILYGVEGQDYTVDENGNVVMIDGATPRTIGDLSGENSPISTITRDLTLGDVISIDENDRKNLRAPHQSQRYPYRPAERKDQYAHFDGNSRRDGRRRKYLSQTSQRFHDQNVGKRPQQPHRSTGICR